MSILRRLLTTLLVFATLAASGPMAVARATPQGQIIVICTGDGPQEIMLGADGTPMTPVPHCPECSLQLLATLPAAASHTRPDVTLSWLEPHRETVANTSRRPWVANARAPPRLS